MNKLQLFKLLRKNINLSYRRSPAFEQNRWAKVLIGFGGLMFILYLILISSSFPSATDTTASFPGRTSLLIPY